MSSRIPQWSYSNAQLRPCEFVSGHFPESSLERGSVYRLCPLRMEEHERSSSPIIQPSSPTYGALLEPPITKLSGYPLLVTILTLPRLRRVSGERRVVSISLFNRTRFWSFVRTNDSSSTNITRLKRAALCLGTPHKPSSSAYPIEKLVPPKENEQS